ncbi:hypothetical protein EVG20_g5808 [Dentipellis fragilis]|uniref:DUF5745 domain-containing protein n=1 Tax=Dentipellis fragilis TaxID=205917 RepID=A0A4Y9YRR3_9AGAM|nr:hypothetical protein EVG20_g5808 [Dentipellis fragilis]
MSDDLQFSELSNPLVASLNALLDNIELPFVLETPLDLTPFLLLAILESLLEARLPIPQAIRESKSAEAKVDAMKIFLGVLENDVIGIDVGLSDVDPRRLAVGTWDEVVFIGKLLCWLGRKMGLLQTQASFAQDEPPKKSMGAFGFAGETAPERNQSPSTRSTLTNSMNSALSMEDVEADSNTTVLSAVTDTLETPRAVSPAGVNDTFHPRRPLCIHEVEDPSFLIHADSDSYDSESDAAFGHNLSGPVNADTSYCDCLDDHASSSTITRNRQPVRYDGWIEEVDTESELQAYEASQRTIERQHIPSRARLIAKQGKSLGDNTILFQGSTPRAPSVSGKRLLTRHTSPTQHTVALLNERARLLSELASLDRAR